MCRILATSLIYGNITIDVIPQFDHCSYHPHPIDWRQGYKSLQSALNITARLIYGSNRYDHITDLLRDRLYLLVFHDGYNLSVACCPQVSTRISPRIHYQQLCQKVNYSTSIWAALSLSRWLGYSGEQEQVRRKFFCSGRTFGLECTTGVS